LYNQITITQQNKVLINNLPAHEIDQSVINRAIDLNNELLENQKLYASSQSIELGSLLFQMLDGSGGAVQKMMDDASNKGETLLIYGNFPPNLDVLPFELMFFQKRFLLQGNVNLFRLVSERGKTRNFLQKQELLKVLFMACSPEGQTVLQFEKEEEFILHRTEKLHMDLYVEDSGSLEGLETEIIGEANVDMVHLSGHAGIDKDLGSVFYMEDDMGNVAKVNPEMLWSALKNFPPKVLFLSGCSTGKRASKDNAASFTEQMVDFGIPFVFGWSHPVSDYGASLFEGFFYEYLSMGKTIAQAVQLARKDCQGYHVWPIFRVYTDATPAQSLIAAGKKVRLKNPRKAVHKTLKGGKVKVLEKGFVGRRRSLQHGIRVMKGYEDQAGIIITGAAGVGKSCLSGKIIERFLDKKLLVHHGKLEIGALFQNLIDLFEQYDIQSGLAEIHSDKPPEEKIKSLFRNAFQELPCIIYLDDFEQNLEYANNVSENELCQVKSEYLAIIRGLLKAIPWSQGKTNVIISSRYPFTLNQGGRDLALEHLYRIPLMSMHNADLDKKVNQLTHINKSKHKDLFISASGGNPRLLEWLDEIAAEAHKYDLNQLQQQLEGKQDQYRLEYLASQLARTQGQDFELFLAQCAVFRKPVTESAFTALGTLDLLTKGVNLTLIEQEIQAGHIFYYWVHPTIQANQWNKLSEQQKLTSHNIAYSWYENNINAEKRKDYEYLNETVYHAMGAKLVRKACYYAILLGQVMKNMQLYYERAEIQQHVADAVSEDVIVEAIQEKDGNVAVLFSDLGQAYDILGKYKEVIFWTDKSLKIDREIFGEAHQKVAIRYNNLGSAYKALGDYSKAIDYYEKALKIDREIFGEAHPDVAIDYNNLGEAYRALGEYSKAIDYYEKALKIDRDIFGEAHPDVAIDYNNLGGAYDSLGEYSKAIDYGEKALEIFVKFLGNDHPTTKIIYNNLMGYKKKVNKKKA
jgi:tetratricopeptide (TPR) repeat protein